MPPIFTHFIAFLKSFKKRHTKLIFYGKYVKSNKLYHLMMQDESVTFSVVIYNFIELRSFENMSIQTLKNISNYITMTLNEAYGEETEILPLAIDKYIAIIDNRLINANELANQTVAFNFNGLRLHRKIKRAEIDSEEQFYWFIDKLFYLYKYIYFLYLY